MLARSTGLRRATTALLTHHIPPLATTLLATTQKQQQTNIRFFSTPTSNNNNNSNKQTVEECSTEATQKSEGEGQEEPNPEQKNEETSNANTAEGRGRGPFTWASAGLLLAVGGVSVWSFNQRIQAKKKEVEAPSRQLQSVGKPLLGGPFELVDTNNNRVSDKSYRGKFMLIYFGFTHCPDVCPDELMKISAVYDKLECDSRTAGQLQPLFITLDPKRDSLEVMREYLREFHSAFVGLTGTDDELAAACKSYRVYYSVGPEEEGDYLVDHSIISYLVDPNGDFKEYYAKTCEENDMAMRIANQILSFEK